MPRNVWVTRHTERFETGVTGAGIIDASLTSNGRRNATELEAFLLGNIGTVGPIPIEAAFVTQPMYSYQTAMPYLMSTGIPFFSYDLGQSNNPGTGGPNFDLRLKIDNLSPCPDTILVVTHGNSLTGVLETVGYTGNIDFSKPPFPNFNRIYHLSLDPVTGDQLEWFIYGDQCCFLDIPLPCAFPPPPEPRKPRRYDQERQLLPANIGIADPPRTCNPSRIFATRHTERFLSGVTTPPTILDASLTENGRFNASALENFLIGNMIPIEAIFVTQTDYSYQTAMPFALASGLPIHSYDLGITNSTLPNFDLRKKLDMLDPCPETVLLISHSFVLRSALVTVGYTGGIEFGVEPYNWFNRLYELTFLPDGRDMLSVHLYGSQGDGEDKPLPCTVTEPLL